MKTTNYKKGDIVLLSDGNRSDRRYEYLGEVQGFGEVLNAYRPLDGETSFTLMEGASGKFAPFVNKLAADVVSADVVSSDVVSSDVVSSDVVGLKWYEKVWQWWKASNRWKHFLFAIPLGAVCGAPFTTGVGLGMEIKDHLYGNRADFVDFLLAAVGGAIGHGAMRLIGLDYAIGLLIGLL